MAEARGEAGRPWHATWFWRSLTLLGLGLALVALGEVRFLSAGGGASAPVLPDYTHLLPNFVVMLGFSVALVGAATALITACAVLLNAVDRRRIMSGPKGGTSGRDDHHMG